MRSVDESVTALDGRSSTNDHDNGNVNDDNNYIDNDDECRLLLAR